MGVRLLSARLTQSISSDSCPSSGSDVSGESEVSSSSLAASLSHSLFLCHQYLFSPLSSLSLPSFFSIMYHSRKQLVSASRAVYFQKNQVLYRNNITHHYFSTPTPPVEHHRIKITIVFLYRTIRSSVHVIKKKRMLL